MRTIDHGRILLLDLRDLGSIPYLYSAICLIFADVLLIFLSLFIGVKNLWLDYIFTLSIGVLAYTIYIVIDDLDNPFRPGAWHLTPQDCKMLIDDIKNKYTVN
jgi:hypothetical protein